MPASKIIAIIDYSYFEQGTNQLFYNNLLQKQLLRDITQGSRPQSLVVTTEESYISAIAAKTLKHRADNINKGQYEINCLEES